VIVQNLTPNRVLYRRDAAAFKKLGVRTKEVETELAQAYARWEQMEALRVGGNS